MKNCCRQTTEEGEEMFLVIIILKGKSTVQIRVYQILKDLVSEVWRPKEFHFFFLSIFYFLLFPTFHLFLLKNVGSF